jgi:hypothetical protein
LIDSIQINQLLIPKDFHLHIEPSKIHLSKKPEYGGAST